MILTSNYGEAGAIERYGPARGLPQPYSGHNAYGDWGPPPDGAAPVITVGLSPAEMAAHLDGCRVVARGSTTTPDSTTTSKARRSWSAPARAGRGHEEWPELRHLG